ncbi:hypothetical protein [Clostridium sp. BJN0013]|uniref:hypothetical protein n=1 Tax=Clostridium sp. BJN0013 TaxID=3236840 RepID=UPI0034C5E209
MRKKRENDDDIKVVVMNPEYMPLARERMFDFFYEKFQREQQEKDEDKLKDAK